MVKHVVLLIILSIAAVFFHTELGYAVNVLLSFHKEVASMMGTIFSNGPIGLVVQAVLSLLIIPIVVGLIVAFLLWLFKKSVLPHTMLTIWVVWVILLVALAS